MKIKYLFHPGEYAVAETERFYASQAAKGWLLEKRGTHLSRFRRGEPQKLRYRMEFSAPRFLEEPGLPDEQVELYEECGWTLAAYHGIVHVFCAPEDSDAPELYTTPEQQADALKGLRRSYRWGWLLTAALIIIAAAVWLNGGSWKEWSAGISVRLVRETSLMLVYLFWFLWAVWETLCGWARAMALHRRLKGGRPIDRTPKIRHRVFRAVSRALVACALLCLLLTFLQLAGIRRYDLPDAPAGPYLTLDQLGVEGEPGEGTLHGETSEVTAGRSLAAEIWDVQEFVEGEEGRFVLYQDVYRLPSAALAMDFAPALMMDAALAKFERFEAVAVDGLDGAWAAGNECVAVKGRVVWYIVLIDWRAAETDISPVLAALGALDWS